MRKRATGDTWDVRTIANLEEAVPLLNGDRNIVLGLPVNTVLAQRLRLPTADPSEFSDMVRIQIEKALPYPPEEVTTDFELIEQAGEASVVSAVAVHNDRLSEVAAPLLSRGIIPSQVTVYAAQRAATHAANGRAFLIYPEDSSLVCAISEQGKLGFTRSFDAADPARLERDLPQVALSAQLQGIDTSAPAVLLDEALFEMRDAVQGVFVSRPDLMAVEAPPATVKLNLLPESWRQRRRELVRLGEWKKRLMIAGAIYLGFMLLFAAYVLILRFQLSRLSSRIARDAPKTEFIQRTESKWKALAPAIDPHYYPIEVLQHVFESLPSPDVQITQFQQSARQISIDGEAKTAAMAYEFAEKVKKNPALQTFVFDMAAPRILPNEHAQFRLEGKPR